MAEHFSLQLVDSFMLAPSVRHLVFERTDAQPLSFMPGQFLQIHFNYAD
ncbi:MAG: ferredoxin--NADP reductase, partial [Xanthomonadales bacterium]|nr:ferredoxin--NADP reductase [Xanthomonadales bacterium]